MRYFLFTGKVSVRYFYFTRTDPVRYSFFTGTVTVRFLLFTGTVIFLSPSLISTLSMIDMWIDLTHHHTSDKP